MPTTTKVLLHEAGPALWPEHKSNAEVADLRNTTPASVYEATYQGNPTLPGGTTFKRSWWLDPANRYDPTDRKLKNLVVARWHSWDTALKDKADAAFTSNVVGELLPDYRMLVRYVFKERLEFPDLPAIIEGQASGGNQDEKLRGLIIEDKASGITALQTLAKNAPTWLQRLLIPFQPVGDKPTRAEQAAVWCSNGCVLLPLPGPSVPWLMDFEDELFNFPGTTYRDQVDAFSQLIIYTENLLAAGYRLRQAID